MFGNCWDEARDQLVDAGSASQLTILILARSSFNLPQIASPVSLPLWFPIEPGSTVNLAIADFERAGEVPLNAPELKIDEIRQLLHQLEEYMLNRLIAGLSARSSSAQSFFEVVKREGETYDDYRRFLETARERNLHTSSAGAYRPSAREGTTLVGRLMAVTSQTAPNSLPKIGGRLMSALGASIADGRACPSSMIALAMRPSVRDEDTTREFGRNLAATMYAACQLSTVHAHAAEFPAYPLSLLQATSYDLRRTLTSIVRELKTLGPQTAPK